MSQVKYLSRDQQVKFLKAVRESKHPMNTRDLLFFTLSLRYGLRMCEARGMKLEHLLLNQKTIYINRGKNGDGRYYPIRDADKKLIEAYLKKREKMTHSDSPYLFITKRGEKMSRLLPIKLFEKYAKIAGIEGHSCHSLRHSCAVNLLSKGVDLFDIKIWLGHKQISSTMVYLEVGTEITKQRMNEVLKAT